MKSLKETLMYIALCWVILYLIFSVGSATIFIQDMHGLVRLGLAVMMFAVFGTTESWHYEIEINCERDIIKVTNS